MHNFKELVVNDNLEMILSRKIEMKPFSHKSKGSKQDINNIIYDRETDDIVWLRPICSDETESERQHVGFRADQMVDSKISPEIIQDLKYR